MGFCVLHYDKQTGSSPGLSQHIERGCYRDGEWVEWHPTNADPSRTHLNRELIAGDLSRDERITRRIKDAGIKNPRKDQVRALTLIMSASCEDMQRIMDEGKFDDWCEDSIKWAQETHGVENVVSAVLHLDEKTPHLHVTVVPIVKGMSKDQAYREKKAKEAAEKGIEQPEKRKYKKKDPNAPRLCAADVMARTKLKEYQTTYAEAVGQYGLRRGIDGSEAKHVDINDWYKQLVLDVQDLEQVKEQKKAENKKIEERTEVLKDQERLVESRVEQREKDLEEMGAPISEKSVSVIRGLLGMDKSAKQKAREKEVEADKKIIEANKLVRTADERAAAKYLPVIDELSGRLERSESERAGLENKLAKQADYSELKRKAKDYDRMERAYDDISSRNSMMEAAVDAATTHGLPSELIRPLASGKLIQYTGELRNGDRSIFGRWPLILQRVGEYIALKCHMGWYNESSDRPRTLYYTIDKACDFIKRHWDKWTEHWNKRENESLERNLHRKGGHSL